MRGCCGLGNDQGLVGWLGKSAVKGERLKGASLTFEPFDAILTKKCRVIFLKLLG